jgi:hypothetical protein
VLENAAVTADAGSGVAALNGTGAAGATIQILVNDEAVASTVVRPNGSWAAAIPLDQPGQYNVSVQGTIGGQVVNAATAPVVVTVPEPLPTSTPTAPPITLALARPNDGERGTGEYTFEWSSTYTPAPGEGFELVFWPVGQDPLGTGFGLASPTTNSRVNVNLTALDDVLSQLEPGPYNWGILLVRTEPYERLRLLAGPRTFTYYRSGGDSGDSDGGGDGGQTSGEGDDSSGGGSGESSSGE